MYSIDELIDRLFRICKRKSDKATLSNKEKEILQDIFWICVDSYNRFPTFWELRNFLADAQYWYALGITYPLSDNLYSYRREVRKAFRSKHKGREFLMNGWERRMLARLPDEVRIYRAMTKEEASGNRFGLSWTLDKEVAEFFRDTYNRFVRIAHLFPIGAALFDCRIQNNVNSFAARRAVYFIQVIKHFSLRAIFARAFPSAFVTNIGVFFPSSVKLCHISISL